LEKEVSTDDRKGRSTLKERGKYRW
jgi:hypothetical protein